MRNQLRRKTLWFVVLAVMVTAFVFVVIKNIPSTKTSTNANTNTGTSTSTSLDSSTTDSSQSVSTSQSSVISKTTVTVTIKNMAFDPASLTVSPGVDVVFTNNDSVAHTVTSNTGVFDSGTLKPGESFSYHFATKGSFPYHCSIHPGMTASVTVQ